MTLLLQLFFFLFIFPLTAVQIKLSDYNEWNVLDIATRLLPKNPIIVQAGACEGQESEEMAYRWPNGTIYAFEPNPSFFNKLKEYASWHRNIRALPFALDKKKGTKPFYLANNGINPRIGSLLPASPHWKWYYKENQILTVSCLNLEEWGSKKIKKIDFLWLNAGGYEGQILQSIPNYLKTIQVIFIETQDQPFRQNSLSAKEIKQFLTERKFEEIIRWEVAGFHGYALFAKQGLAQVSP